ncbi:nitrate reductase molybdenum cofactor assembly chaperone [Corynebacterium uberis]|uniref:nitrate reductase molybdenum cofactor assembly chaperone n=1 Tax=Corynebacterium TaxID=1716 RepID=UPI001D09BC4F|nr:MULTISPECIES: nitrate reductase molybdenum cofactor assembly chaperone [Corynebacterium]MCZ9309007.1 nitrate reductase molybdenum cofactor assembly chaperone [Corynebacterium sp. c6VSa_13]UDL74525.1 nitrate reductase molybdenum cofactor assembly chaperone [Corynebacterium uberis]UDL76641.1 nitrate reductase molybdenum cofactor assembly chaperone [Corynebacterium uberis]UDL81132.1 nitrate reductase molybdenum cofactor assembly chaperone [Corynebacterium uberis]UDL83271.1 nitrate reductase mo
MRRTHTGLVPEALVEPVTMTPAQRGIVAMAVAVLLDYPDDSWEDRRAAVAGQIAALPATPRELMAGFLRATAAESLLAAQARYVETFDQRRRCSLFLSYYAVGDTRQRGAALLAFKDYLADLGLDLAREELPDHLCVVLEAAALEPSAFELLAAHRDGIEVLRSALEAVASPYAGLISALCTALPPIDEDTAQRYLELIRTGPPAEMVGLGQPTALPFPNIHTNRAEVTAS